MQLPVYSSCCCGCTLRTGSLIIGYLGAIGTLLLIIIPAIVLASLLDLEVQGGEILQTYYIVVNAMSIIVYVIQCVLYCILIIGVHKSIVKLLRIYVVCATVLIFFVSFNIGLNFGGAGIIISIGSIIGLLLQAYFILIVRSFWLNLQSTAGQTNVSYPAQGPHVAYPSQPGYPAQPEYSAPPDYNVQPGYQGHMGPQIHLGFAKTGGEQIENEEFPPPKH